MDGNSTSHAPVPPPTAPAQMPNRARLGSFERFDPTTEDWDSYISQFLFFMDTQGITDPSKQRSTFFSVCGMSTYSVAWAVLAPLDLANIDFTEIMKKLRNHYSPRPSLIALQHTFHTQSQAPGESMTGFVTALWNTAHDCKYGGHTDGLVCVRPMGQEAPEVAPCKEGAHLPRVLKEALAYEVTNQLAREVQRSTHPIGQRTAAMHQESCDDRAELDRGVHQTQCSGPCNVRTGNLPPPQTAPKWGPCTCCRDHHKHGTCHFWVPRVEPAERPATLPKPATPSQQGTPPVWLGHGGPWPSKRSFATPWTLYRYQTYPPGGPVNSTPLFT